MDSKVPQYQRAVTPTIDSGNASPSLVKGKVLSYNTNVVRGGRPQAPDKLYGSMSIGASASARVSGSGSASPRNLSVGAEASRPTSKAGIMYSSSTKGTAEAANPSSLAPAFSVLPRSDLIAVSEDLPSDGIIFARTKTIPETLVVFRTPEERLRNPERLNLDRRQLDVCPLLEQEQRLRLLNFQNNSIRMIQNLENLPNLIFLDLYNNKITSLDGPLSTVKGLRVLMAGKNKIGCISNLQALRKLDVLDLHSNEIRAIEGLDGLADLRVLNLAGNRISVVNNLSSLASLTELNLRRNNIDSVRGLNQLPALQRIFLSHNAIATVEAIQCLFEVSYLIELSLDGNPLSEADPSKYRAQLVAGMLGLRHLDLRRITDDERSAALQQYGPPTGPGTAANSAMSATGGDDEGVTEVSPSPAVIDTPGRAEVAGKGGEIGSESWAGTDDALAVQATVRNVASAPGEQRKGLQKYINQPIVVGDAARERDLGAERSGAVGVALEGGSQTGGKPTVGTGSSGLAALARAGKLFNTHSVFELEVVGPDERALVAVGENWEWAPNKRLLTSVTEASLYHMKRHAMLSKFGAAQFAALPALKCLRFAYNDFTSLKSVDFIPQLYGKQIEHLIVKNCPLSSECSPALLRGYFIATMPKLLAFNEVAVSPAEREATEKRYGPLARQLAATSPEVGQNAMQRLGSVSTHSSQQSKTHLGQAARAGGSLLQAYRLHVTRNGAGGGAGQVGHQRPAGYDTDNKGACAPLLSPAQTSVGSVTAEHLKQVVPSAGHVWEATPDAGSLAGGLSQRALARHAQQTDFFSTFDAAVKRAVIESILCAEQVVKP